MVQISCFSTSDRFLTHNSSLAINNNALYSCSSLLHLLTNVPMSANNNLPTQTVGTSDRCCQMLTAVVDNISYQILMNFTVDH